MILFDGRGSPSLRGYLGRALSESTSASFAIRRIRLARLDLLPEELRGVGRCRVLLGRLDADTLADTGASPASARTAALLDMAASGRLEVKSAGLLTWDPDFSILGSGTPESDVVIFGCHQFVPQQPVEGLAMACAIRNPDIVRAVVVRFEELWERGHDALEAVTDALCRSRSGSDA